jgi:hypothetical protein
MIGLQAGARLEANEEARAVIAKAVQAHGGPDKLAKLRALRMKTKGTLSVNNQAGEFTAEMITRLPDCSKLAMTLEINTAQLGIVQVQKGSEGWSNIEGQTEELKGERLAEQQARVYSNHVASLVPLLKDKGFELSPLGEVKVKGQPAVGVRVVHKDRPDISLFFDKTTGLLIKNERRGIDLQQKEVARETFFSDYKDYDGRASC